MVDAGFTETSAFTKVGIASPLSGSITTESALLSILLAARDFATRGGRVWLTGSAKAGVSKVAESRAIAARLSMFVSNGAVEYRGNTVMRAVAFPTAFRENCRGHYARTREAKCSRPASVDGLTAMGQRRTCVGRFCLQVRARRLPLIAQL